MSSINTNSNAQLDSLIRDAVTLAADLNGGNKAVAIQNIVDVLGSPVSGSPVGGSQVSAIVGGSTGNTNVAQGTPMSSQAIAKLFGNDNVFETENDKQKDAAKNAVADGGGRAMSLYELLMRVGNSLVKAMDETMDKLDKAATALDATNAAGGQTAKQQQDIQRNLAFLQGAKGLLDNVNKVVSNLIESDTQNKKDVISNIRS